MIIPLMWGGHEAQRAIEQIMWEEFCLHLFSRIRMEIQHEAQDVRGPGVQFENTVL